jgi:hypothetical protein
MTPIFDRPDQLQKIEAALLQDEQIHAVYDMKGGGTGFMGITTSRVIVYDKAYLRSTAALVSIPYSRIATVAAQDQHGLLAGRGFFSTSTLILHLSGGTHYTFEFRGNDKAIHAHNLILWHILRADQARV